MTPNRSRPGQINYKLLVGTLVGLVLLAGAAVGVRYWQRKHSAQVALREAESAFAAGEWEQAWRSYRRYLGQNSDDVPVLLKYARAHMNVRPQMLANVEGAKVAYRRAFRYAQTPEVVESLLQIYYATRDFSELINIAGQQQADLWLARAFLATGRNADADALLDDNPSTPAEALLRARLEQTLSAADPLEAFSATKLDDPTNPDVTEALLFSSNYRRLKGDLEGARADLKAVLEFPPNNARLLNQAAIQWLLLGNVQEAQRVRAQLAQIEDPVSALQFLLTDDWLVALYQLDVQLAMAAPTPTDLARLSETLEQIQGEIHRYHALPFTIELCEFGWEQALERDDQQTAEQMRTTAEEALAEFRAILPKVQQEPPAGAVALLEARVARLLGDWEKIVTTLKPYERGGTAGVKQLLAYAYGQLGNQQAARPLLEQLIRQGGEAGEWAMGRLMEEARFAGNGSLAAEHARQLLDSPIFERKLMALDALLADAAARGEAVDEDVLAAVREMYDQNPRRPRAAFLRARAARLADGYQAGLEVLQRHAEASDDSFLAGLFLAQYQAETSDPAARSGAISQLEALARQHPNDVRAWRALADVHRILGDVDAAVTALGKAAEAVTEPAERSQFTLQRARLLVRSGRQEEAASDLEQLRSSFAESDPRVAPVLQALLALPIVRADTVKAQQLIDALKAIDGEQGRRWRFEQARVWIESDQREKFEEAMSFLNQIGAGGNDVAVRLLIADALVKQDRVGEAIHIYEEVADRSPQGFERLFMLNMARQDQEALARLLGSSGLEGTESLRALLEAARTNDTAAIQQSLEKLLREQPDNIDAQVLSILTAYRVDENVENALAKIDGLEQSLDSSADFAIRNNLMMARISIWIDAERQADAIAYLTERGSGPLAGAAWLVRSMLHRGAGDTDTAAKDLKSAIEAFERVSEPALLERRMLAQALMLRGDEGDLQRTAELLLALERDTKSVVERNEVTKWRALVLLAIDRRQHADEAIELLERVLRFNPRDDARLILVDQLNRQGRYRDASDAVRAAPEEALNPALNLFGAQAALAINDLDEAVRRSRATLSEQSENTTALGILVVAFERGASNVSRSDIVRRLGGLIEASPTVPDYRVLRARVLNGAGQTKQAIAELTQFAEQNPKSVTAAMALMVAEMSDYRTGRAVAGQWLDRAEQLEPDAPQVIMDRMRWLAVGEAYDDIGKWVQSGQRLTPEAKLLGGLSLLRSKVSAQQAVGDKLVRSLATEFPPAADAQLEIARHLVSRKDYDAAEKTYRAFLARRPQSVRATNDLAWLLGQKGQLEDGLALATKGLTLAPTNVDLRDTKGEILWRLGRYAAARAEFNRLLQMTAAKQDAIGPRYVRTRAHFNLARIDIAEGKLDKAAENATFAETLQKRLAERNLNPLSADEQAELTEIIAKSREQNVR